MASTRAGAGTPDRVAAGPDPDDTLAVAAALRWERADLTAELADHVLGAAAALGDRDCWLSAAGWAVYARSATGDGREAATTVLAGLRQWGSGALVVPAARRLRVELAVVAIGAGQTDRARALLAPVLGAAVSALLRADAQSAVARCAVQDAPAEVMSELRQARAAWSEVPGPDRHLGMAAIELVAAAFQRLAGRPEAAAAAAMAGLNRLRSGRLGGGSGTPSGYLSAALTTEWISALLDTGRVDEAQGGCEPMFAWLGEPKRPSRQLARLRLTIARAMASEAPPAATASALTKAAQDAAVSDAPDLEAVSRSALGTLLQQLGQPVAAGEAQRLADAARRRDRERDQRFHAQLGAVLGTPAADRPPAATPWTAPGSQTDSRSGPNPPALTAPAPTPTPPAPAPPAPTPPAPTPPALRLLTRRERPTGIDAIAERSLTRVEVEPPASASPPPGSRSSIGSAFPQSLVPARPTPPGPAGGPPTGPTEHRRTHDEPSPAYPDAEWPAAVAGRGLSPDERDPGGADADRPAAVAGRGLLPDERNPGSADAERPAVVAGWGPVRGAPDPGRPGTGPAAASDPRPPLTASEPVPEPGPIVAQWPWVDLPADPDPPVADPTNRGSAASQLTDARGRPDDAPASGGPGGPGPSTPARNPAGSTNGIGPTDPGGDWETRPAAADRSADPQLPTRPTGRTTGPSVAVSPDPAGQVRPRVDQGAARPAPAPLGPAGPAGSGVGPADTTPEPARPDRAEPATASPRDRLLDWPWTTGEAGGSPIGDLLMASFREHQLVEPQTGTAEPAAAPAPRRDPGLVAKQEAAAPAEHPRENPPTAAPPVAHAPQSGGGAASRMRRRRTDDPWSTGRWTVFRSGSGGAEPHPPDRSAATGKPAPASRTLAVPELGPDAPTGPIPTVGSSAPADGNPRLQAALDDLDRAWNLAVGPTAEAGTGPLRVVAPESRCADDPGAATPREPGPGREVGSCRIVVDVARDGRRFAGRRAAGVLHAVADRLTEQLPGGARLYLDDRDALSVQLPDGDHAAAASWMRRTLPGLLDGLVLDADIALLHLRSVVYGADGPIGAQLLVRLDRAPAEQHPTGRHGAAGGTPFRPVVDASPARNGGRRRRPDPDASPAPSSPASPDTSGTEGMGLADLLAGALAAYRGI